MRRRLLFWLILTALCLPATAQLRIVSYNVENLFHPDRDTLYLDEDFTPEGKYHWDTYRYRRKLDRVAQVIANLGEWQGAALVGLCEVENARCLDDFTGRTLRNFGYRYLHRDGPDPRGIDCALLYDPRQVRLIRHAFLAPVPGTDQRPAREILYASFLCRTPALTDTLHILLCHLPSQTGGSALRADAREASFDLLRHTADSILARSPRACIVIMGDMNTPPAEHIRGLHNLMCPIQKRGEGTYKWQGVWTCLDHIYVSEALYHRARAAVYAPAWLLEDDLRHTGMRPKRTFQGLTWNDGYSDHLPVFLDVD